MQKRLFYLLVFIFLFTGCMKLGPDFKQPDPGFNVPDSWSSIDRALEGNEIKDRWWEDFGNTEINDLVNDVLKNNLDIKKASARILEIKSGLVQTKASRFPNVGVQAQALSQQLPAAGAPGFKRKTENYSLSLPAAFEIDLWGRISRSLEAAEADLLAAEENRRTIIHTMIAESVTLYLYMEALERRISVTKKNIVNFRKNLEMTENRYKRGLTSILDVKQSRAALSQAKAALPSLYQETYTVQQRLSLFSGRYPETRPPRVQPEDYFKRLEQVKPGLHSDVLMRRPDVRAAEARLISLNARIGVARASRFPRIALTGNFGYSNENLSNLFRPENELWSLASGITQTIFDAGRLKAVEKASKARYMQGVTDYAKTVLTAFFEVENALITRKEWITRRELVVILLKDARETEGIALNHYKRGLVGYTSVLQAQQGRLKAEESLILADLSILTNRVTLYRALGGGFPDNL
ncbi:MAG: efflux transporter outer membrane subunit [Desulfobacteraceae bacterium]|nr:efflux transporter outer membrane subunit [Desulfobacteraceae bacterium]